MTYLPPELVELIMIKMNGKTFTNCRRVCKSWRLIADRLAKDTNIWKSFCINDLEDKFEDIYENGNLPWFDIYKNICLWSKIDFAWQTSFILNGFQNTTSIIRNVNISRGGILFVVLFHEAISYNCMTLDTVDERICGRYLYFIESNCIKLLLSVNNTLYLKPSEIHNLTDDQETVSVENVELYRIVGHTLYYITKNQELCMCKLGNRTYKKHIILATWYSSEIIRTMECHNNKLFLLTYSGTLLYYDKNKLNLQSQIDWIGDEIIQTNMEIFYLCRGSNFVYCNERFMFVQLSDGRKKKYQNYIHIKCILLHGTILILGTFWGQILLFPINEIEDLLNLDFNKPLEKHVLSGNLSQPIIGLNVHEGRNCHTLFISTQNQIFVMKYEHFSFKKLAKFWTEKTLSNELSSSNACFEYS